MPRLTESDWLSALELLHRADPGLRPLVERFSTERIQTSGDPFQVLVNAIVGQQISVPAAAAIFGRLQVLVGRWVPEAVLALSGEQLRGAGLSVRKVEYVTALARSFASGEVDPSRWNDASDELVLRELVSLRGIGRWTAEMFLIFQLQRPDILPLDDIGLLRSAARQLGWDYPFDPKKLGLHAEAWRPYRTVAVWLLWRALDPHPVIY